MLGLRDIKIPAGKFMGQNKVRCSSEARSMLSDCAVLTAAFLSYYMREVGSLEALDELVMALGMARENEEVSGQRCGGATTLRQQ
jgi:hypothetical protein